MDRRRFIQLVAGGLVALATPNLDNGLEMIAGVSAEEKKPTTINEILAGTSFEDVYSHNYSEKTKKGNVVVMFYDDSDGVDDCGGRLAQVYKAVEPEFRNSVTFLKYSSWRNDTFRLKLGVNSIPYSLFYKEGKVIDQFIGGPKADFHLDVWVNDFRREISKLYK